VKHPWERAQSRANAPEVKARKYSEERRGLVLLTFLKKGGVTESIPRYNNPESISTITTHASFSPYQQFSTPLGKGEPSGQNCKVHG